MADQDRPIAVEPKSPVQAVLMKAVERAGGRVVSIEEAEGLVWADPGAPQKLPAMMESASRLDWIGLPFAGIESFVEHLDEVHRWTCAKGVYATPVAEHVVALALAGMRGVIGFSQAKSWPDQVGTNLIGAKVTVFGGGGITRELIRLLEPFRCEITVVRRSGEAMHGARRVLPLIQKGDAVEGADLVVLALALTEETANLVDAELLDRMSQSAWLVNVARGGHVDQDALLAALEAGEIGGAALDVTVPEPLPDGHRLWGLENLVISPHVGNTPEMGLPLLVAHVEDNVRRFCGGEPLVGAIDVSEGY